MKRRYRLLSVAFALASVSACRPGTAADTIGSARAETLTISSSSGKMHQFQVEVARTEEQQARGLMFRGSLAPDRGMIFPMNPPRMASFWMKNTVIPLDIIFIRADGTIARIAAETEPYSLAPIGSGEPVAAVLELRGGRAAELGIVEDDKVGWSG